MPPPEAMEAVSEDKENLSPSLSLLQRLKRLREWQERQKKELLQAQTYSHTSAAHCLPPLVEETSVFESTVTEDATPAPRPQQVEDHCTPVGRPGVGLSPPVVPATPSDVHSQGTHSQELLVTSSVGLPEEDHTGQPEDNARQKHDSGTVDVEGVWERQEDDRKSQASPLTPPGPSVATKAPHPHHRDPGKCDKWDAENVTEGENDAVHADAQLGTPYSLPSASPSSPPEDPTEYLDEGTELVGGEETVPYRAEKYKSTAATGKEDLRIRESCPALKNLMPNGSFFLTLTQGPEDGTEGKEEAPRPRQRFLKKGQGTARFRMRPTRLKRPRTVVEECDWQGRKDAPQTSSPAPAPVRSQFRLPVESLHLQGPPPAADGQSGFPAQHLHETQRSAGSLLPSNQLLTHTARPSAPTLSAARPPPTLRDLDKQQRKEEAELSAFEKLEELADDSSFSSNSSTVLGLLKQGQLSVSSTPMRTPPPLALQETPVVGSLSTKPRNLAESHFNVGLQPESAPQQQQQQIAAPVDVREVLAQLKAMVRLEGHSVSDITESDIQSFLDAHQLSGTPPPTSTPLSPCSLLPPQARPHHVHFASEGVQVLEYQRSDTEGEDTLTDATSLDSDLLTTSDLEALTHLSTREPTAGPHRHPRQSCREDNHADTSSSSSGEATLTEQGPPQKPQPVVLHFSPPPPRPPQSASTYIWSIFGKERDARKPSAPRPASKTTTKEASHQLPPKPPKAERTNVPSAPQTSEEELEAHKTLLLAKVVELEKETKQFRKDNARLQKLRQEVEVEKKKLAEEKRKFHEETAAERKRFQEYVDRERNALWSERQRVVQRPPPAAMQPQEHVAEVMRLREQARLMQEEAERKESLHQFTVKKLNDRIKTLENDNKKLQDRNKSLQVVGKDNQDLRLKVDRTKAGGRTRPATQPLQPKAATQGRPKAGTRPTTVDGVTKTLDRLTKPQPVITKHTQTKAKTSTQDPANSNLRAGPTETEEPVLVVPGSSADPRPAHTSDQDTPAAEEASPTPADDPQHSEDPSPLSGFRGSSEDAGLEHTERTREDGVQEVIYANGNRKEIHPSGDVTMSFYNGDRKEVKADRTVYVYGSDRTSHTTYLDGREELVFPNGQRETRRPDGSSEISFPDGSRKSVTSDGTEICTTRDGSVVRTNADGSKVFEFPSGQREVHRDGEKRREYPDGTVKIVHPDGRTETRYNTGRIRIRDREGNLILDTHVTLSPPPPPPPLCPQPSLPS